MCGIVGYVGKRDALPVLLESLERVTYRGYDSFGVALLNGRGIELFKSVGSVDQAGRQVDLHGQVGIGHTRWATVGRVSEPNAHPHTDCTGQIAIVHNGDIDNFRELRDQLRAEGHVFRSETDSEVIAHLVEKYQGQGLAQAMARATAELQGCYAIVAMEESGRRLAISRKESPVVVGLGEGEAFVASDAPAILPYTNRVIYPEDGDLVLVTEDEVHVWHNGQEVDRPVHVLNWDALHIQKDGYEHFMLKEICEQPQAIRDTLAAHSRGLPGLAGVQPEHVLLLGCGTSFHAALVGEHLLAELAGISASARISSEFGGTHLAAEQGLAVALSQSGETSDTIGVVRRLRDAGWRTVGITNVPQSSLARLADDVLYTHAGPEVAVAATKTFTTQLTVLAILAAHLAGQGKAADAMMSALRTLPSRVQQVIAREAQLQEAAEHLAQYDHLFIIAKGLNTSVALEAALKFKEVAYLHAEGCPAGELKHGPFALLEPTTPVLALLPNDAHRPRMLTAVKEIRARGAPVLVLTEGDGEDVREFAEVVVSLPATAPCMTPVTFTVASHLLSYHCARIRSCPIDRPRNLAKSVTVP